MLVLRPVNLSGTGQLRVFNHGDQIPGSSPKQGHDYRLCAGIKSKRSKCTAEVAAGEVVPKEDKCEW